MNLAYFITGTDTDIGKTWCAAVLMHYFRQQGQSVIGMKPVASGCQWLDGQLKNEDALILQAQASLQLTYDLVNPYAFEPAISPHIASSQVGELIDIGVIKDQVEALKARADVLIVEGVGGWMAPLNDHEDIADLAQALQFPVILVVGLRIGCINHAKLTYNAIIDKGLRCTGWIGNCPQPDMLFIDQNIQAIQADIDAPLLGVLPYSPETDFSALSKYLQI